MEADACLSCPPSGRPLAGATPNGHDTPVPPGPQRPAGSRAAAADVAPVPFGERVPDDGIAHAVGALGAGSLVCRRARTGLGEDVAPLAAWGRSEREVGDVAPSSERVVAPGTRRTEPPQGR